MSSTAAILDGASIRIPRIADASTWVTYHVEDPERVKEIARDVGAEITPDSWRTPSMQENHYPADGDAAKWILVVRWKSPSGVRFSAQSASTSTPSLAS